VNIHPEIPSEDKYRPTAYVESLQPTQFRFHRFTSLTIKLASIAHKTIMDKVENLGKRKTF